MTALPAEFELDGETARFAWHTVGVLAGVPVQGTIPCGVFVEHGDHALLVPWAGEFPRLYTLDSLRPLTVGGVVVCPICGRAGRIEQGEWLPEKDGGPDGT